MLLTYICNFLVHIAIYNFTSKVPSIGNFSCENRLCVKYSYRFTVFSWVYGTNENILT